MITLRPYQEPSADNIERALMKHRVALDTSDLGTGKSYVAAVVAGRIKPPAVLVMAPKAVLTPWRKILREAGVPGEVMTYEKLRTGNTPFGKWDGKKFVWHVPNDSLLVWDEAHKLQGDRSQNARMAKAAKPLHNLLLSGTMAESPLQMRVIAHLTGMADWNAWWPWCRRNGCKNNPFGGMYFSEKKREQVLKNLHEYLFPEFGSRIRIKDLGDQFPKCYVIAEAYDFDTDIAAVYDELENALSELAAKDADNFQACALTLQLRARQEVELRKVPGFLRMTEDLLAEGQSIAIFVNFRDTIGQLVEKLKCPVVIGDQSEAERDYNVASFQSNESRVIVVSADAGGAGLGLHDLHGGHPRTGLVSPSYNAKTFRQILGRLPRDGAQSASHYRIICAAGTIEESICSAVQKKCENMDLLNEGITDKDLNITASLLSTPNTGLHKPPATQERLHKPPHTRMECPNPNVSESSSPSGAPSSCTMLASLPSDTDRLKPSSTVEQNSTSEPCAKENSSTASGPVTELQESATLRAHAKHSPSSLKNKLVCPGWRNDPTPTEWGKKAADRGTRGHEAIERGTSVGLEDDPDLKKAVDACLKWIAKHKGRRWVEGRVAVLDQFGFFDLLVVDGKRAVLDDYKFTNRKHPADSPQFWSYVVGILDDPRWSDVEEILVETLHPFLGFIDQHTFTRAADYDRLKLLVFAAIEAAKAEDPETFRPNPTCIYCERAGRCPALAKLASEVAARYAGEEIAIPDGTLHGSQISDPDVFAKLLKLKPIVEKAASGWSEGARRLWQEEGIPIPGYQLLERSGVRKITAPRVAYDYFLEKGGKPEEFAEVASVSISDMEDLVGALAPRGKKGAAKQELSDILTDRDAITLGSPSFYLKEIKNTD